ncbi:MAG: sugar ABC transporter permease [Syntrophomonadaceae bacterium]|nr:sugar ABC transporter permease [Syntrophomonadaceae bacterium]
MNFNKTYPTYYAIPALLLFVIFFFLPGVLGIFYSFTDWNSLRAEVNFVGLKNYLKIFSGQYDFVKYILNTVRFTGLTMITKTVFGIIFAMLLTHKLVKFQNIQRMVIFIPQVMSFLIVGLVFKSLLNPVTGFFNNFLKSAGLSVLARNWLSDSNLALSTVIAVDTWKGVGYLMIIVIAGIHGISSDYYEAAQIDGASFLQKTWHITLPLLKPVILNVTVLNLTYGLRVFDIIYALTNGGPGHATEVINTAVYSEFSKGNYAMGTTLSGILFVFVMLLSFFILRVLEPEEKS